MRNIKFKATFEDKIVYGDYIHLTGKYDIHYINDGYINYPIKPETLCQYIFTDINGKDVYENDRIRVYTYGTEGSMSTVPFIDEGILRYSNYTHRYYIQTQYFNQEIRLENPMELVED